MKHVVIVEDNRDMLEVMRDFLSHEGYRLSCFSSPIDALSTLFEGKSLTLNPVDLVITDVLMKPMHGTEFMKKVKATHPEIPFILISAFGETLKNKVEIEGVQNGSFKFVHKPFSFKDFKTLIQEELKKHSIT